MNGGWRWVVAMGVVGCSFDSTSPVGSGDLEPGSSDGGGEASMETTAPSTTASTSGTSGGPTTDPPPTSTEPATSGTEESSSGTGEPPLLQIGPYGEAMELSINSGEGDDDPTLRADLLEIYWSSFRGGSTGEVYRAERDSVDEPFGNIQAMDQINDGAVEDGTPELSPDGKIMVIASPRGSAYLDLWMTTRDNVNTIEWTTPVPLSSVSDPAIEELGFVQTDDGLEAFFCRRDRPLTYSDLVRATRLDTGSQWGNVTTVASLDDGGWECNPWIDATATTIVYDAGTPGVQTELYWARREDEAFGDPQPVQGGVNTDDFESDPWLSPDGAVIVFTRQPGFGAQRIYWAAREP